MERDRTRRRFLGTLLAAGSAGVAGCQSLGSTLDPESGGAGEQIGAITTTPGTDGDGASADDAAASEVGSGAVAAAYEAVAPSVCSIRVYDGSGRGGQGSGFVYDDGYVVTNEHVVADGESVSVRFQEGGWIDADVVATDVYSDLGVLSVPDLPDPADPVPFVAAEPPVGTRVVAIGNPFGFSGSVSAGVVSGVDRTLQAANDFSIQDAVQTDAAVNPGNSGGPLVTLDGAVVGVVSAGGGDNIGLAISAALTRRVVPELVADGEYDHSYVGVRLRSVTPRIAEANPLPEGSGVYIDEVLDDGPADGVLRGSTGSRTVQGVRTPVGGDVVVAMDGTEIPERQSLASFLALETDPGDTVSVRIVRDGDERTVDLTLGERPAPDSANAP